jgi:V8-like Glu-specific endopeptidase
MYNELDTLEIPNFDTLLIQEETSYNIGNYNSYYNNLNLLSPTENIFAESHFTRKRQASKDYDINNYPIRTSVKLFKWENDSIKSRCSGSMISRKHVLTACHCVAKMNKDSLAYDSFFVCPVLDNGEYSNNFDCSWVKKIFFFENWNMSNTDFAVLELEKPIGDDTGWISIGFDSNDSSLLDGIYYKFSYPAKTELRLDSNSYNGDTLYYSYGIADWADERFFGVELANGIPGESGSSLVKIKNENTYTSYGVFSYSAGLGHSRLTDWKYYALKSVIIDDLELSTPKIYEDNFISIYPNPTSNYLNIILPEGYSMNKILLFDMNGRKIIERANFANEIQLNLSSLHIGSYILIIDTKERRIVKKVIKYGR